MIARFLAPLLWKLLAVLGIYAKGRADQRVRDRMKASEDRIATIQEAHRDRAEAMAADDADLVRNLTDGVRRKR